MLHPVGYFVKGHKVFFSEVDATDLSAQSIKPKIGFRV
jgi:hypothetical protein